MVYPRIFKDIPCTSSLMDIHGISKDIPCIYQAYEGGLHIHGIYQAYARHIPEIRVPDGRVTRPISKVLVGSAYSAYLFLTYILFCILFTFCIFWDKLHYFIDLTFFAYFFAYSAYFLHILYHTLCICFSIFFSILSS